MSDKNMEEKKKLLFIFNPHSGKGLIRDQLVDIVDTMVKHDYEVTIYPTQSRGDATRKTIEEAANYDLVVCSGGDGTLDEVVSGMIESDCHTPIGYIPAGSTNDFGATLGIPKTMKEAAETAVSGVRFMSDVGFLNDGIWVYVAAFGLFTEVTYETSQELKNVLGHAAYILEGAKHIWDIPSYTMQVMHDGEVFQDHFIFGMVTNSVSVGGFKGLTGSNIKLDDGLFEVTLIRTPRNPIDLNEIILYLADQSNETKMVYSFKTDCVQIISREPVSWTRDGEYGGTFDDVVIRNEKQRIPIIVNPD